MAVKVKIEPLDSWIEATLANHLGPQARSQALAGFAREKLAEAQAQNHRVLGAVPPHTVYVDGRQGAVLESVKPDGGRIVFEFDMAMDVLKWIGEQLVLRSPVVSGAYRGAHTLFADGVAVSGGALQVAEQYTFINPLPYARRLEIGRSADGSPFLVQVPNRIYERTAEDAKRRFGNLADIRFSYTAVISGRAVNQQLAASQGQKWWLGDGVARPATGAFEKTLSKTAQNKAKVRFPSIIVRLR